MIKRKRVLLAVFSSVLLSIGLAFTWQTNTESPNIVYILADDLGYGDVSIYNEASKISTPHIDVLAKQGIRFLDAHTPSSVCTPTRYSILTGRYPWRSRLPVGVLYGYSRSLIEKDRPTVAKYLQSKGYNTAVVGKWHLGVDWQLIAGKDSLLNNPDYGISSPMDPEDIDYSKVVSGGPKAAGFGYSFILPASLDMAPYCYFENQKLVQAPTSFTDGNKSKVGYSGPFWRAGKMAPDFNFYKVLSTLSSKAIGFIQQQSKRKPFFLYLPLTGPHTPWVPNEQFKDKSPAGQYGDFVQEVDQALGDVLDALDKSGLSENTIVFFASDNGPYWRSDFVEKYNHRAAGPYRGMKGDAFEGGHRVPFIVRWPKKIKEGSISTATTTLANLTATLKDLFGDVKPDSIPEDSYSILPVLLGKDEKVRKQPAVVHSSSRGYFAIRKGDWKLIQGLGSGGFTEPRHIDPTPGQAPGQLYNLSLDPGETKDLYTDHPEKVQELELLLAQIKSSRKRLETP